MKAKLGSLLPEGSGKLGGHVLQYSPNSHILRSGLSHRNVMSTSQQYQRIAFEKLVKLWSELSSPARDSWNQLNVNFASGFHFFLSVNLWLLSNGSIFARYATDTFVYRDKLSLANGYVNRYVGPVVGAFYCIAAWSESLIVAGSGSPAGFFRSTDGGISWTRTYTGLASTNAIDMVIDRLGNVCTSNSSSATILRSTDFGLTFSVISLTGESGAITGFCIDEDEFYYLALATTGRILISLNRGLSWTLLATPEVGTGIRSICYAGSGIFFVGGSTNGHILRSTDHGVTWQRLSLPVSVTYIRRVRYCGNGVVLAVCQASNVLLRSTDMGLTWTVAHTFTGSVTGLELSNCLNGVIACSMFNTSLLYISRDRGLTWSLVGAPLYGSYYQALFFANSGKLFLGTAGNGIIITSFPTD